MQQSPVANSNWQKDLLQAVDDNKTLLQSTKAAGIILYINKRP